MRTKLYACGYALLGVLVLSACDDNDALPANAGGGAGVSGAGTASAGTSGAGTGGAGTSGSAGEAGDAGAAGSQEPNYAQWPMPNSAGLGLPNPANYDAKTRPGVVRDLVTGLFWLQNPGSESFTRAEAISRCAELSFAGFDDWRVPAFIELVSLFDAVPNEADPLEPSYLAPVFQARGRFWSAAEVNASGLGRLLDFTAAGCGTSQYCSIGVSGQADEALGRAFCVRNSEPPATSVRFEKDGESVTDLRTGLIWQDVPAQVQTVDYADAVSACDALETGARLPSINELLSILVPKLDKEAFQYWPNDAFAWSSSTIPAKPDSYWLGANGGATEAARSFSHNRVECVR